MEYKLLSSLYYQDKEKYEETYKNRIHGESTYTMDFNINEFPAFVVITPEILNSIHKIFILNNELKKYKSLLPKAAIIQYTKKCLVDEIKKTNDIESIYSTKKEIQRILNSPESSKKNRFYGLVTKYNKILSDEKIPLTNCEDIRNLYNEFALDDVLADDPNNKPDGEFFRTEKVYVGSSSGKTVHTGIYPEVKIIELMSAGLTFLKDEKYDYFIRIAVFHYLFGYIHPFYDGNGRMSRFISSYLLSQELDTLVALRLAYTIKQKQDSYYKMFKISNDKTNKGDLTYFVIRFLEFMIESLDDLISALKFKYSQLEHYEYFCNRFAISNNDKTISYYILFFLVQYELFGTDDDYMNFNRIKNYLKQHNCKIGENKLRNLLKMLSDKGLITVENSNRAYLYKVNLDELEKL